MNGIRILAVLSAGAGAVHFAVMGEHFALDWTHGVFFAAVGWAQLVWAAGMLVAPGKRLALAGVAGNALVVVVWGVSRTVGVPPGTVEAAAAPDILATVLEVALVCGALILLERGGADNPGQAPVRQADAGQPASPRTGVRRHVPLAVPALVTVLVAGAVGAAFLPAFAGAGHEHGGASEPAAQDHHPQPGQQPAQQATDHHGQVLNTTPPTDGERAAAALAVDAARREIPKRWPSLEAALKDGFAESIDTGGVVHLTNNKWIMDDRTMDPTHPEALVYYRKASGESILLGAMYIMPPGAAGPVIGGSLTHWHAHDDLCGKPDGSVAVLDAQGLCPQGSAKLPMTPEMLHVWVVDYPDGPFGDATAPALRTAIGSLLAKGS
ncbi:hypothetical protein OIE66_12425 [Nonomuraea sp. NBC_01738]|uniref:hypothetical protein n=1 Tax=Nonomuraea sp. NBC_01738 TaxID=2976003 RepID=UPI002E130515|nr:hypothetical protein OIE66_12425 [Nonomuraea sp. NBC_01738]